ncbi:hypothetical protein BH09GEM1_BH09GEM1_46670 [soil metagenome]
MTEYFSERDGDALPDVVNWCATIDAHRAQALAGDFLALYPESLWRESLGRGAFLAEREDETGRSAVEELAAARWDDVVEIPDCLRRYVEANLELFETYQREGRALVRSADEFAGDSKPPWMSDLEWRKRTAVRR